jgi:hypothetical protein
MAGRRDLNGMSAIGGGREGSPSILEAIKVLFLVERRASSCEHILMHTDLTRDQIQNPLNKHLVLYHNTTS